VKFFGYILRNARRNPIRSMLTIGSIAVCGFLAMILLSLFSTNAEVRETLTPYNRVISMSAQGFAQPVPIAMLREIPAIDERSGVNAIVRRQSDGKPIVSPFSWYGGKFRGEANTFFAQFGCDPDTIFEIYPELTIPPE
jgi:putative ABC transport system permease protein